mgnify:CR=1 FL=1
MIKLVLIIMFMHGCVSITKHNEIEKELNECLDQKYEIDNCQRQIDSAFFEMADVKYHIRMCKQRLVSCNKRIQNVEKRCKQ